MYAYMVAYGPLQCDEVVLKPAVGYDGSHANTADVLSFHPAADELGEYEVEDILDHCSRKHGRTSHVEYLVKWRGYDMLEATCEPESNLANCFHMLNVYLQFRGLR